MLCLASRALSRRNGLSNGLRMDLFSTAVWSVASASSNIFQQEMHWCQLMQMTGFTSIASGSLKGHGYSKDLLSECIYDAKRSGRKGLCILSAEGRKREFLADREFLTHQGFSVSDVSDCGINLMALPFSPDAPLPEFRKCAKHPQCLESGFVIFYTDQCPFTYYWVPRVQEAAAAYDIPLRVVHITDKEAAQNLSSPVTTYALFYDGEFVTQSIQSDKKLLKLAERLL